MASPVKLLSLCLVLLFSTTWTATASATTNISYVETNGFNFFYRHANPTASAKTVLLLHGYPSSSHQYRHLLPQLAARGYRVIAPDLPGFGFTTAPGDFVHTFANLTAATEAFVDALGLESYAVYIFDYGAPTGLRLALRRPEQVRAIVTQNGNAYEEGFGDEFWAPIKTYWASGAQEDRDALRSAVEFDAVKWQYTNGAARPEAIAPETYFLDYSMVRRDVEAQLDLFYDYQTNVELYPEFHDYFRRSGVPVLAVWGRRDDIFVPAGAEAFKRDVEKLQVTFFEAGHFVLDEGNEGAVADEMEGFFDKYGVFE